MGIVRQIGNEQADLGEPWLFTCGRTFILDNVLVKEESAKNTTMIILKATLL